MHEIFRTICSLGLTGSSVLNSTEARTQIEKEDDVIQLAKISQQNTSSMSLLQLPAEIRNQIWLHALDGVEGGFKKKRLLRDLNFYPGVSILDHNACFKLCVTEPRKRLDQTTPGFGGDKEASYPPTYDWDALGMGIPAHPLEFLCTCRQIYEEAGGLLYSKVLSFEHESSFIDFMACLTLLHYSNLRSLHFKLEPASWREISGGAIPVWVKLAVQSPGLQNMNICIKKRSSACQKLTKLVSLMLTHTTARKSVTVILPRRGPYRYAPSVLPPKAQPHPLQISKESHAKLVKFRNSFGSEISTSNDGPTASEANWECLEWPAERQLDFVSSVIKRLSNPWAQLDPQNYIQDDRPPRFVLFNSIERAFWSS